MKRTTYIIIGMLVGTVCLLVGGIALMLSLGSVRGPHQNIVMQEGEKTFQLPECKYVTMKEIVEYKEVKPGILELENQWTFLDMPLVLTDTTGASPVLTMDAGLEKMLQMEMRGDTLDLKFSLPEELWANNPDERTFLGVFAPAMKLALPKDVDLVSADLDLKYIEITKLERENYLIDFPRERVFVNECSFDTLRVENGRSVEMKSGRADNLFINCDQVYSWMVADDFFHVDTEYLRGSGNVRNRLTSNECRRVIWIPMGEGAQLDINIACPVEIIVKE